MSVRKILTYPDPRLRRVCAPVTEFDGRLKALVDDMADTMYDAPGIGLAAIQIGVSQRVVVMDLSEARDALRVFINPEISVLDETPREAEEGCLSVPGIYVTVSRPSRVRVKAQDIAGKPFELEADELLSVCIQHEVDHLNGKVFVDYLSRLKQVRLKRKLKKDTRQAESEAA